VYLTLFDSYVCWLESQGRSSANAVIRARVAFSLLALINLVSVSMLLNLLTGIPIANWVDDHRWSIWAAMAVVAAPHWLIARSTDRRSEVTDAESRLPRPSRFFWFWYLVPVTLLFIGTMVLALGRANY